MAETRTGEGRRLGQRPGQVLDRTQQLSFQFDGHEVDAIRGDTIASALLASGQRTVSRSFKYHRPRGVLCASGDCPNCLVQVGEEPNVRACRRQVEQGMQVLSQNRWPSISFDMMHSIEAADRFLPAGFYYKTFIRPRALWPFYERILRHAAGLGRINPASERARSEKAYLHCDVTVVGGGPSGMQAALAAASSGAEVVLVEEEPDLGGHLRYRRPGVGSIWIHRLAGELAQAVRASSDIVVLGKTTAIGVYEGDWIGAVSEDRLYKIRTGKLILATGTVESPILFPNNDLPGIMLTGAVQRLLRLWGVRPGERAVVVAAHQRGWFAALDLMDAGVEVIALVTPGVNPTDAIAAELKRRGVWVISDATVARAEGNGELEGVWLNRVDGAEPQRIGCDLLVVSAGFVPAGGLLNLAGGSSAWDSRSGQLQPGELPDGLWLAGEITGDHSLRRILEQGEQAGLEAALSLGFEPPADRDEMERNFSDGGGGATADFGPWMAPDPKLKGKKGFVCLCEDVSRSDLRQTVGEGYDSAELLKRYSTVSMGPCQGRMCNPTVTHLRAADTGQEPSQAGSTTARPPIRPVSLAALAGQKMEPVRRTPMDEWHRSHGAKMMVAGMWMRPEHYGNPLDEVQAVRERVGLIDVSTLGKFHLHGSGVPDFLEQVYTNRWRKLAIGRVRYGVMVNEEGVVMDDGVTAHVGSDLYYMSSTSGGAQSVYQWCQWWLQSGWNLDVRMLDATELRAAMNLTGPQSRAVLRKVVSGVDLSNQAFPYMSVREAEIAGAPAMLLRIGFTGELGYEIHTPSHYGLHVWQSLLQAGQEYGIGVFGVEAQRVLRLEKGHVIVRQDTDSLSSAYEAGMGWAVKLGKDDFLGRPSLQLAHDRDVSRQLVGFEIPDGTLPQEAHQIVREGPGPLGLEIIGRITSARWSPTLEKSIGLAWLPPEMSAVGSEFDVRVDGELKRGLVVETPFYDPGGSRLRS